jgi:hypothetical protein
MFFRNDEKKFVNDYWQEYEEKTCEKVLTRGMAKYVSGWKEFDEIKQRNIMGLVVTTTGGFRFHYFPQKSWLDALTVFPEKEQRKEITVFIPKEKIVSCELIKEKSWWKRILYSSTPYLFITYMDEIPSEPGNTEKQIIFEVSFYINHS